MATTISSLPHGYRFPWLYLLEKNIQSNEPGELISSRNSTLFPFCNILTFMYSKHNLPLVYLIVNPTSNKYFDLQSLVKRVHLLAKW